MAACFKTAVSAGVNIAISPHLDDGLGLGEPNPLSAYSILCTMSANNPACSALKQGWCSPDDLGYFCLFYLKPLCRLKSSTAERHALGSKRLSVQGYCKVSSFYALQKTAAMPCPSPALMSMLALLFHPYEGSSFVPSISCSIALWTKYEWVAWCHQDILCRWLEEWTRFWPLRKIRTVELCRLFPLPAGRRIVSNNNKHHKSQFCNAGKPSSLSPLFICLELNFISDMTLKDTFFPTIVQRLSWLLAVRIQYEIQPAWFSQILARCLGLFWSVLKMGQT